MAVVEGYPELNFADDDATKQQAIKDKEQRSLFALETQLQKTKLCRYQMKGLCKHGSDCRFAHSTDELVQLPNLQKTRMCPNLLNNGVCKNAGTCTFAHHESELKKVNLCHKTAVCTWYLAGKCRNGTECEFAHGEHELKGASTNNNRKMQEQQAPKQVPPAIPDGNGYKPKEPMFIKPSITAITPKAKAPAYCPPAPSPLPEGYAPATGLLPEHYSFQPPLPQWIGAGVPGSMPNFIPGMQPDLGAYHTPQPEMPMMLPNYMSIQPPPMMQPYTGVGSVAAPPGFSAENAPNSNSHWQLTELAVQFNMLSEEVKRLQDYIIPQSMQSTNSGSDSRTNSDCSNSGDNRTPRAAAGTSNGPVDVNDGLSFEEKVAHLQNELKHVMDEGQRCGKFFRQAI